MEKLNQIEAKVDKMAEDITEIKVILERNTTSLEYHIKRTDLLESQVETNTDHRKTVNLIVKIIGVAGTCAATILAIWSFFK